MDIETVFSFIGLQSSIEKKREIRKLLISNDSLAMSIANVNPYEIPISATMDLSNRLLLTCERLLELAKDAHLDENMGRCIDKFRAKIAHYSTTLEFLCNHNEYRRLKNDI